MSEKREQSGNPALYWNANRSESFATIVAAILTLIFHIAVWNVIPEKPKSLTKKEKDELQITIEEPKFDRRIPDTVEANPFANNDLPDNKNAPESYKNQRVADDIIDPNSKSKMPFSDGEIKNGKKIVSGTSETAQSVAPNVIDEILSRPLKQASQTPTSQSQTSPDSAKTKVSDQAEKQKSQEAQTRLSPAKDSEKSLDFADKAKLATQEQDSKDSVLQALQENSKRESPKQEKKSPKFGDREIADKQTKNDALAKAEKTPKPQLTKTQEEKSEEIAEELPKPKARPSLSMRTPAGPLADNRFRACNQGTFAVDSRFSEFGAYQQRMIEAIARQWNLLAAQYDLSDSVGTQVLIEFFISPNGELTRIGTLFSNSTHIGRGLCEQSILTTAPYGEWTEEMKASLGEQDCPVKITYFYR